MKNKKKMKRGKGDGGKGEVLTERNEGVLTWRNGERMGHGFARMGTDWITEKVAEECGGGFGY